MKGSAVTNEFLLWSRTEWANLLTPDAFLICGLGIKNNFISFEPFLLLENWSRFKIITFYNPNMWGFYIIHHYYIAKKFMQFLFSILFYVLLHTPVVPNKKKNLDKQGENTNYVIYIYLF